VKRLTSRRKTKKEGRKRRKVYKSSRVNNNKESKGLLSYLSMEIGGNRGRYTVPEDSGILHSLLGNLTIQENKRGEEKRSVGTDYVREGMGGGEARREEEKSRGHYKLLRRRRGEKNIRGSKSGEPLYSQENHEGTLFPSERENEDVRGGGEGVISPTSSKPSLRRSRDTNSPSKEQGALRGGNRVDQSF